MNIPPSSDEMTREDEPEAPVPAPGEAVAEPGAGEAPARRLYYIGMMNFFAGFSRETKAGGLDQV